MAEEIRRRRTGSPEIDAMVVIEQAMEPLDARERGRVIQWAEGRYVPGSSNGRALVYLETLAEVIKETQQQSERLDAVAKDMGGLSDEDITVVFEKLLQLAQTEKDSAQP